MVWQEEEIIGKRVIICLLKIMFSSNKSVLGADLELYRIFLTFLLKYDVTLYTDRR